MASTNSTLHPNLSVSGAREAIDFYVRALGAEVVSVIESGGIVVHSDLRLGGSTFTVAEPFPEMGSTAPDPEQPVPASFTLEVADCDAAFARAVEAGARAVSEPTDEFHGGRIAQLRDPFGHRWFLNQHLEDVAPEELQRRVDAWTAAQAPA
ncbi:VOC family protein [Cellulomonas fimi]|uniref:Glyoxalase/bleomycin resistance protein/dioxygenase n=1 Tax=Cellulomonas fimi (strain ATCC 484 / DSM 20113 / JCM 1341 / CCUG 24087 / LMG 16345 / NBRC 15513 / NCIMB 8980 / NCTC 7547 / NRS-133) TaxID=590998 RepID=F4H2T4_CELFA|nr:VOC family protein [Cellulomonas fimi]AEE46433.1 Glyoxalase/bleomycin resistance protein/dioxygenase [Cellulomonas fimi ATCC 484]NNH07725.1 VOC family protein [Cellulomonas fimi]VEH32978.1 Predicted enzyme related to lactoylglutathione lyase [Cellulomonas fimi]